MSNKLPPIIQILCILTLFFASPHVIFARAQETPGEYAITVVENPLSATVQARIPVKDGHIFMAPYGADHLPAGWAAFVNDIQVRDQSGNRVSLEPKPNGVWQLSGGFTGTISLSYRVDLSFTKSEWPYGNEQAGSFQDNALFLVTKALFVVSDVSGKRRIKFEGPQSWKISTPWEELGPRTFLTENNNDLLDNSFVFGNHVEYVFTEGNFTFVLALIGAMKDTRTLIAPTLQKVVRSYARIFDKTPRSKYLMTVFYANQADSEAFDKSSAFTEHDRITANNLIMWGNTLAHEFFHSWNGHAIRPEDYATSQWFSEGFTEYFANLALVQQGLISRELFIKKMENHLGHYVYFKSSPAFDGATIKEAGTKKGRYRLGVYDGGWSVAFCLDLYIRGATENRKDLADLMRAMYAKYGLTGKAYRYEDLVTTATETAGVDLSEFFKKYVEGKETLPVQEYLKRIGFDGYTQFYDGEFFIFDSPSAGAAEKALKTSFLAGR